MLTQNMDFRKTYFYISLGGHPSRASEGIRGHPRASEVRFASVEGHPLNVQKPKTQRLLGIQTPELDNFKILKKKEVRAGGRGLRRGLSIVEFYRAALVFFLEFYEVALRPYHGAL